MPETPPPKPIIRGSCACSSITWTSNTLPTSATFCHCITCRKISGGPFIAFMDFPLPSITFSTPPKEISISPNATRGFCDQCGSTLTMVYKAEPENVGVAMGSLDEEGSERVDWRGLRLKHIYVRDPPGWFEIPNDGLEREEEMSGKERLLVYG
ncbi:hypothetical protein EJ08DRAFT_730456 [Tothia fuscella]|uniref:CENP-V/GFA domain-containing protein n=1 Tax=Tothia fuscella TaxID=1048955 RepID=A0A9P4U1K2_9PEZI|nr:hypothetical protein EJ08DRAFT_730456 [Tothia fuscella]